VTTDAQALPDPTLVGRSRGTDFYGVDDLLGAEERALRDRVRAFCDEVVVPRAADSWEQAALPEEIREGIRDLAIAGGSIEGHGCPGMSVLGSHLVLCELARGDGSVATYHGVHTGLAMLSIGMLGSEEQKERWLPSMAQMDRLGAFALTEPDHGSDAVTLETRVRNLGDGFVIDGEKRWIGNVVFADLTVVWARDAKDEVGAYVVEKDTPGFRPTLITGKIAKRASWQADIALDDVRVPAGNRLPGATTFDDAVRVLTLARPNIAWGALGHAVSAYEKAVAYTHEREQFGAPIAGYQLTQFRLAKMLAELTHMRLLCLRLAQLVEEGRLTPAIASLAKMSNAEKAKAVVGEARDLLGGNGILLDNEVGRHLGDVEVVSTVEGTDVVHALIVGREITGLSAFT
jgi:glutaryl-CoA dehydrogenase